MKRFIAFCFAFVVCLNAAANTFGNDHSDAWVAPGEDGWGALMIEQQNTIFLALFVYGPDGKPTWYSATLTFDLLASNYTGELIATTGPSFTGQFNPSTVTRTVVGSATLVPWDLDHATLTYDVGTQSVTKQIERLTWASNQLGGLYYGGLVGWVQYCNPSGPNGFLSLIATNMTITHNGSQLTVAGNFQNNRGGSESCAFAATYAQSGRMGSASGNFTCDTGRVGTFTISRLEATVDGFLAGATFESNACSFSGRLGAIKIN
jgi:hypothetical protein